MQRDIPHYWSNHACPLHQWYILLQQLCLAIHSTRIRTVFQGSNCISLMYWICILHTSCNNTTSRWCCPKQYIDTKYILLVLSACLAWLPEACYKLCTIDVWSKTKQGWYHRTNNKNIQSLLIMSFERLTICLCEGTSFQKWHTEWDSHFVFLDPCLTNI